MIDRVLDVQSASTLRYRNGCLQVDRTNFDPVSIPLHELGAVVVHAPLPRMTSSALAALADKGIAPVFCNDKHVPTGVLTPLHAHHVGTERLEIQAQASKPLKKRAWQQIIKSKIINQGVVLKNVTLKEYGYDSLAKKVRSGDPQNMEARASRHYWRHLFDDSSFRRSDEAHWLNHRLNYGYAVLRSMTVSAIVTRGLHPGLGIHHHNRYDPQPLASDLMEPFRPLVDEVVAGLKQSANPESFTSKEKMAIAEIASMTISSGDRMVTLSTALRNLTNSLVAMFTDRSKKLDLPRWQE
tara:strand:- start:746 stop:1636 length:891 start_codon:yes stop_codon:yes gene_type:complete